MRKQEAKAKYRINLKSFRFSDFLNLQRTPHHRYAAPADRQTDDLTVLLLGAGLEQARPAHVDALADAKRKLQIGLGPQRRQ